MNLQTSGWHKVNVTTFSQFSQSKLSNPGCLCTMHPICTRSMLKGSAESVLHHPFRHECCCTRFHQPMDCPCAPKKTEFSHLLTVLACHSVQRKLSCPCLIRTSDGTASRLMLSQSATYQSLSQIPIWVQVQHVQIWHSYA